MESMEELSKDHLCDISVKKHSNLMKTQGIIAKKIMHEI